VKHSRNAVRIKPYILQIDGSSRLNPGPAGIGVVLIAPDGSILKEISRFIGVKTNNQAEYEALLAALNEVSNFQLSPVIIQTDSELLYYQLTGKYQVKDEKLKLLYNKAKRLLSILPAIKLNLVPREANKLSDRLAKKASAVKPKALSYEKKNT